MSCDASAFVNGVYLGVAGSITGLVIAVVLLLFVGGCQVLRALSDPRKRPRRRRGQKWTTFPGSFAPPPEARP